MKTITGGFDLTVPMLSSFMIALFNETMALQLGFQFFGTLLIWLTNYANNYLQCLVATWYLACAFQLVLLSPLLIIPLYRWVIFCSELVSEFEFFLVNLQNS